MADSRQRTHLDSNIRVNPKELDEVSCPICLDHPHNAVLLLCSSYEKGSRPYICDTSYRHSNCLDRFRKFRANCDVDFVSESDSNKGNENPQSLNLKYPLCRGIVCGWAVVEEARRYLNMKERSCSKYSCSFSGSYRELCRHARTVYPTSHPSEIDLSMEKARRGLGHERDCGHGASATHPATAAAVLVGDYVTENRLSFERDTRSGCANRPWWSILLFPLICFKYRDGELRPSSRAWLGHRYSSDDVQENFNVLFG